jgi:glucosamine kinase
MILIADSGSTKADWLILEKDGSDRLESTQGFNPFFHTTQDIQRTLAAQLVPKLDAAAVTGVYYYGAGIHDSSRAEMVSVALKSLFINALVEIHHDLLAAARATCGHHAGICCILGTGSNSCLFDGEKVVDNVPSLGYLLGDEGSGTHLGRGLLKAYFYRELPPEIEAAFNKTFPEGGHAIKDRIYEMRGTNVYLASFSQFLNEHKSTYAVQQIVANCFAEFLDRHVRKYPDHQKLPIHFVGSIAYHYEEILRNELEKRAMKMGTIIRKPIYALGQFHQKSVLV